MAQFEQVFDADFDGVEVMTGRIVDDFLEGASAVAMAYDASLILLSSRVRSLAPYAQRLIIAHELAHTAQMRRAGRDLEQELEREAWAAAKSAVQGKAFRIDGAARRPLFAKGLIAMDPSLDPRALDHYTNFKCERLVAAGAIEVTAPKVLPTRSLETVLDEMIAGFSGAADKSFVLCAHGNPDGLTMPVVKGSGFAANTQTLEFLMQPNATTMKLHGKAGVTPLTPAQIGSLIAKMQKVRALGIVYVEFRGCALGAKIKSLEVMRAFLGCTSVSAPDIKSSWAMVHPNILSSAQFSDWVKRTPGVQVTTTSNGRCGLAVHWTAHSVHFATESKDAIPLWLKERFFRSPPFSAAPVFEPWMSNFGLHGLHVTPIALPMDPSYAAHLKRVVMTSSGIVKM